MIITLAAIVGLAILAVSPAMASPITFAQYLELGGGNQWTITTSGGTTVGVLTGQELFVFQVPTSLGGIGTARAATLTLNASSNQAGDCDIAGCLSGSYTQPGFTGTFSFIDNITGKNLLSGIFDGTGAQFTAAIGGNGGAFDGTTTLIDPLELKLSSDYLNFLGATLESASFSLSSLTPAFAVDPITFKPIGRYVAAGSGTFSYDTIPEPATLSLIGGALLGLGMLRRKMLSR